MGHDILKRDIVVKCKCGPRMPKSMEPMTYWRDIENGKDLSKGIPHMSINDLCVWGSFASKQGAEGGRGLDWRRVLNALIGHRKKFSI